MKMSPIGTGMLTCSAGAESSRGSHRASALTRLMTLRRDHLTKAETLTVAAIEEGAPVLAEARALIDRFQSILRRKAEADLDPWLRDARPSLIASFVRGITKNPPPYAPLSPSLGPTAGPRGTSTA